MAATFSVDTSELTAIATSMSGAPRVVSKNLNKAGRQSGFIVERAARIESPVDIGNLRAAIGPPVVKQSGMNMTVEVTSHAKYSAAVHDGRKEVVPINAKVLRWEGPNGVVFAMRSRAVAANPYMDRGLTKSEARITQVFDQALTNTLRELGLA